MAVHDKLALIIAFTLTSLSTVVVALRFYARYVLVRKLASTDWVMLSALIATWGSAVTNYYQIHFFDYSKVNSIESATPVVVGGLLSFWIYRLFYIVDLCLIKISILLFYNYVTSVHKSFHRIVKTLMVLVIASSVGLFIAAVFSCNPPSDAWSADIFFGPFYGRYPTNCYDPRIVWYFSASWNLLTDCIIWILPIPFVLNLQSMAVRRRLELAGIFSIGIVAIAASAVRLWVVTQWASSFEKQATEGSNLLIWSQVEQHAGIIAASIPFLRPLARKALLHRREQPSPSPAAKLIQPRGSPDENPTPPRAPIIPSPAQTFGSNHSQLKAPPSPLSPIAPVYNEMAIGSAV